MTARQVGAVERSAAVARTLAGIRRIAMLPEVTLRIVDIATDRRTSAADLQRVAATDPMLCMRMLKVVNSAFYGLRQPVTSIERAVIMLGVDAVRNIALAASLGRLAGDGGGASAQALWRHSLAVAAAAQSLAVESDSADSGEAFLAGLLHDVGFIVELQADGDALAGAVQRAARGEGSLLELELQAFGADHQDFGHGLCLQWQLPGCVTDVLGHHHAPAGDGTDDTALARVVRTAEQLACAAGLGFAGHPADTGDAFAEAVALGLTGEAVQRIAERVPDTTASLQRLLMH